MSTLEKFKQKLITIITVMLLGGMFIAGSAYALITSRGNTLTAEGISPTGTIRLSVNPNSNFQVSLNEQMKNVTNNNTLENVLPGTYELKIQKNGYTTWQQQIQVKAGLITDITAQLFPGVLQLEQLSKTNITQVVYSPSRRVVVYSATKEDLGGSIGIWQQNLQKSNIPLIDESPIKITNLTSLIADSANKSNLKLKVSPNDDKLLLQTSDAIYLLDMGRYNEPSADNKLSFTFPVDSIDWLAKSSNNLLIRSSNLLIDYDLGSKRANIIVYEADRAPVYAANSLGVVYSLGENLYKYNSGVSNMVKLENIGLPKDISRIYSGSDSDSNFVLGAKDKLYYLNTTNSYLGTLGAYGFITMSPTGQNLIVKDGDKYKSLKIDISLVRNTVDIGERQSAITEISVPTIVWEASGSYFVFKQTAEATNVYSADRSGNNLTVILSSDKLQQLAYTIPQDNSGLIVCLLDSASAGSSRVNLYKAKFTN